MYLQKRFRGLFANRFDREPLERKFAEAWQNFNLGYSASGNPPDQSTALAQLLNTGDCRYPDPPSPRDFEVAATIIQWLGSSVGHGFIRGILEDEHEM